MMLGFSKDHIKEIFTEIVQFSELKDFIDQPLKKYSRGMKSRLAFSIAAMVVPEVLLIDETLSAGDTAFTEKAGRKIQQIICKSKLVIVVTHQIGFVQKFCTKGLWLDSAKVPRPYPVYSRRGVSKSIERFIGPGKDTANSSSWPRVQGRSI